MGAVEAFDAGYTAQVSVMPPGAKVAPNSKLNEDDAGKAPAIKGHDGRYHGYNWMSSRPNRDSIAYWVSQGSSIGFLASDYPAIDIDILNEEIANAVVEAVVKAMGPCLIRTGQYPKRLLIFRCDEPLRSFDMHYEKWNALLGAADKQLIQFLGKGRQYVMFGQHPRTMQPYHIEDPGFAMTLGPASLPVLTPEKVLELFTTINAVLARFGFETRSNAEARIHGGDINQDELKAPSLSDLASLVSRAPNSLPDRDDYISFGYAVKAASQDDPEAGFEIFSDWCARWDQGGNDPAIVRQDWDKMVPPYRMGWDYLLKRCSQLGADVSDFRFGPAEPRPDGPNEAAGLPFQAADDAEVQASQEALQAAAADAEAILSDRWIAKKFVRLIGSDYLVPIGMAKSYCYHWDGFHWVTVPRGVLMNRVGDYMTSLTPLARQVHESPKEQASAAMRLGSAKTQLSIYGLVMSSEAITCQMDQLDADPDLLDTPDGPIHLPTGTLLKPDKAYMLTKPTTVPMDPTGHCPRWRQFIQEVTKGDAQLAFYLQCLAGYALTGHTREQVFPFFVGDGGNGKSVFLNVLADILGPNACSVGVELFQMSRYGSNPDYQLAQMHGARLVTTSETKAGGMWDEQRIKQVTGEDKIEARRIYGQPFEFHAQCTLIVAGNHAPDLEDVTEAMVRRIRIVPFDFKPKVVDRHLHEKLKAELPGILAWCVSGAMAWYQHGLPECTTIKEVTGTYLEEQDSMSMWLEDCVVPTKEETDFVANRELYDSYATWCRSQGIAPYGSSKFIRRVTGPLRALGVRKHRKNAARGWAGMQLKPVAAVPNNVVNFPPVAPPPPRG